MVRIFLFALVFIRFAYPQGSVLLVGGGSEDYGDWSDIPYRWMVDHAPNKKILILHYSTVSTFLPPYFQSLGAAEAVSFSIPSLAANDSTVYKKILEYDGIFLRGGDQWEYVKQWNGTLTEQAVTKVFERGGVIGGTSAGAMVLSSVIADAKTASVVPRTAIRTPLNSGITFTEDFLGFVPDILCDTHFYERGRIGRLLAMLAVHHRQSGKWITGIGIDDATALGISADGTAEVFGSGVVSVLTPTSSTVEGLSPGKQLDLSKIPLRQWTKGSTFQIGNGTPTTTPLSIGYTPTQFSTQHKNIILDGGNSLAEWIRPGGSLNKFLSAADTGVIGILTGTPDHQQVTALRTHLDSLKFASSLLIASPFLRNTSDQASALSLFSSFIAVNLPADSLPFFTDTLSVTGNAFRKLKWRSFLLLGDPAAFAGTSFVNKLEITTTAAYRGRLTAEPGLSLFSGMLVLPRVYESDSYIENRTCGLLWGIGKLQPSYGLFLDNSSFAVIQNGTLTMYGASPGIIFDLRSTSATAFPDYIASGGIGPRQNAALNIAEITVLPESLSIAISTPTTVLKNKNGFYPGMHRLLHNYPNPFNPSTTIEFVVTQKEFVTVTVSDILGRKIESLAEGMFNTGAYRVEFRADRHSSGIYLITMNAGGKKSMIKAMLIK